MAGIPGNLYEEPFVNFGVSRSRAFALAKDTARWLFATDSDMIWHIDEGWDPNAGDCDAYDVAMGTDGGFQWRLPLIHKGTLPWVSIGAVHEYSALADGRVIVCHRADAVHIDMTAAGNRGSMEKSLWHLSLLEEEHEKNPGDPRTMFYLAQTLKDIDRLPEARELFQKRAAMGGFLEEAYYAQFMAATLAPDWETRQAELLAVWESRPHRLEPLATLLRELNSRDLHHVAYLLAQVPVGPLPEDQFFVHENAWCWGIKFERSIAAYWVGRRDESLVLCDELLAQPDLPDAIRAQVEINRGYSAPPPIPMFGELDVETVGSCNRTCPTCLRNSTPDKKSVAGRFGKQWQMPEPLYQKVIDDAVAMGFKGVVNLQHFNEPVQDPRIARFATYAKAKGVFSQVVMHSNGDLLTERKAKELDGTLDVIRIALYDDTGGRPMDEEQAAPRRALLESWFSKTKLEWTGGGHLVTHFSPWANLEPAIAECRSTPCRREVQMRMIVTYTGEMALCCDDISCLWGLGNVADKTVFELWYSPKHVEIMATLSQAGGREAYDYCRICPRPDGEWQVGQYA
jgi:hypothetical protein